MRGVGLAISVSVLIVLLALLGAPRAAAAAAARGAAPGSVLRPRLVDWPLFGRVPERTHYLPDAGAGLDPPLKEAWSIDTHGLIEFPPAIANGVAYVINKFGNGKAVRLRDRKVLWELQRDRKNGKPTDVTAPVYHEGQVYGAFLDGTVVAGDAKTGKEAWKRKLHAHLESSPLAVGGTSTSAPTRPTSSR